MIFNAPITQTPSRPLRAWQALALPLCLDAVRAAVPGIVVACTGSGKSVLLAEVIAQRLLEAPEAAVIVVTTPTRRLVNQLAGTRNPADEPEKYEGTIGARIGVERVGRFFTSSKDTHQPVIVACNDSAPILAAILQAQGRKVDLWIADEAHRTETQELIEAAKVLAPRSRLGCTATAFRSDEDQTIRLFETVLFRYTFRDALRDGVIVPWRVIPWVGTDVHVDEAVAEMIATETEGPGAVNALTIEDAEKYAEFLTKRGLPAMAVHSKLPEAEQDRRLALLKAGELRVIVYPSLLSEGADFPWLRWIAFRREVGARVRFVQEFGRVLRVWLGKTVAIVLDPHGLYSQHGLLFTEALAEAKEADGSSTSTSAGSSAGGGGGVADMTVTATDAITAWVAQLVAAARDDQVVTAPKPRFQQERPATKKQIGKVRTMGFASRYLPPEHRDVSTRILASGNFPNAAVASDLIELFNALARRREVWAPPVPIWAPTVEMVSAVGAKLDADTRFFAHGDSASGARCIAVYRGQREVLVQPRTDVGPKTWLAAPLVAAIQAARRAGEGGTVALSNSVVAGLLTGNQVTDDPVVREILGISRPKVTWVVVPPSENPAFGAAQSGLRRAREELEAAARMSA